MILTILIIAHFLGLITLIYIDPSNLSGRK